MKGSKRGGSSQKSIGKDEPPAFLRKYDWQPLVSCWKVEDDEYMKKHNKPKALCAAIEISVLKTIGQR